MKLTLAAAFAASTISFVGVETSHAGTVCGSGPTVKGIDVSYYQGSVDWPAVAADGVEFAFVRVSDGTTFLDPTFDMNWDGTRAAGVVRGAYQFFRPGEDPIEQADILLDAIGHHVEPGDLPPVIDVEVSGGLDSGTVSANVQMWIEHVEAEIGRAPIVYTGKYFYQDSVGADLSTYPLWHAQYTGASCPNIADQWDAWAIWQYDDAGDVAGIGGGVDMNRWNGDRASLDAFLGPPAPCESVPATGGEIDDTDACFVEGGPSAGMRHASDAGENGELVWTHTTAETFEQNYAQWNLGFDVAGTYKVEVYTSAAYAQSKQATYVVHGAGGQETAFTIDQTAVDGWQELGEVAFDAGADQFIHIGDNTGEAEADAVQLVFDAVRLTPVGGNQGSNVMPGGGGDDDPGMNGDGGGCSTGNGAGSVMMLLGAVGLLARSRKFLRSAVV